MIGYIDDFLFNHSYLQSIIAVHNRWLPKTCSIHYWTVSVFFLVFYCDWLCSDLRISHFFSFHCPLVDTPQLNWTTELPSEFSFDWISYEPNTDLVHFIATVWLSRVYKFQFSYPWKTCFVTSWFPRIYLSAVTHLSVRFLEMAHMS
jgi:hypothetical protein